MAVNTQGLSGYALAYANALNAGASDQAAHQAAQAAQGGSGLSQNFLQSFNAISPGAYSGGGGGYSAPAAPRPVTYQDIIKNAFGGDPAKYAAAILEKQRTGQSLTNAAQAAAFQKANPQYFPAAGTVGIREWAEKQGYGNLLGWDEATKTPYFKTEYGNISMPFTGIYGGKAYTRPEYLNYLGTILGMGKQQTPEQMMNFEMPPQPEMPQFDLQYPDIQGMSYEEAMRRAAGEIDPQTALSRMSIMQAIAKRRERLPLELNMKGQLFGGLREGGEMGLTQEQAQSIEQLNLEAAAKKAQLAEAIRANDQARAQQIASDLYQVQRDRANLAMQQWQQQMTAWQNERNRISDLSKAAIEAENERRKSAADAAKNLMDLAFNWEKMLLPWTMGATPAEMLPYEYATANARLPYEAGMTPYQEASIRARLAGGRGGSRGGLTAWQQYQIGKDLAEDKAGLIADLESGKLTHSSAFHQIENDLWAGLYTESEARALKDVVNEVWNAMHPAGSPGSGGGLSDWLQALFGQTGGGSVSGSVFGPGGNLSSSVFGPGGNLSSIPLPFER
ncbi:MAG: hypothetical protein AB1500_11900 [Bacillota bacterium]